LILLYNGGREKAKAPKKHADLKLMMTGGFSWESYREIRERTT